MGFRDFWDYSTVLISSISARATMVAQIPKSHKSRFRHNSVVQTISSYLLLLTLVSCTSTIAPTSTFTYHFQLPVANLHRLDAAHEQYVLWLKMRTDNGIVWNAVQLAVTNLGVNDSLIWTGDLTLHEPSDSIERAVLSIEPPVIPATPSSKLIAGAFIGGSLNSASLTTSDSEGIGDYSTASGSVLFTTKSSDTNRAKSEFYLMQINNGIPAASLQNLPLPKAGWVYGLWVLDSNFYPLHQFFYGSFANAAGPDTDPTNEGFPFPGGFRPAPLNDPGAKLEITLEPSFAVQNNTPSGPSSIPILWLQLQRFIDFNESLGLQNSWSGATPSGTLSIY